MQYSIIIPAHHRPASLGRLLASLAREAVDFAEGAYEVLVVIDGEDAAVLEQATCSLPSLPLVIVRNTVAVGAAAARNQAARIAKGDTLVFLDDDVEVAAGWAKVLQERVQHIDILTGDVCFGNPDRQGVYPERIVRSRDGWPLGAHMVVRRELLLELGGFDPYFADLHNEDSELVARGLAHGARWERQPALAIHHEVAWWPSPSSVIAATRYAEALPILLKRYPQAMRKLPLSRLGPLLFPREFLLTLFLPLTIWPLFLVFSWRNRAHLGRALPYFFAKWPCAALMYRWHLWKSAWKEGIFVV